MLGLSTIGMTIVSLGGLAWYVHDILTFESETEDDVFNAVPVENRETKASDLITIGTGTKAEQSLGAEIYNGRSAVFVSGGINRTIYNLLRSYMRPDTSLEILFNPELGGNVQISDLKSRFMCDVKSTNQIKGDGMTMFNIDGDSVYMIRNSNNAIIKLEGDTKEEATYHNRDMWAQGDYY
jgi:hypothetical protein